MLKGKIIPFKLADIGEGITEVQILQWYVKEGSPVKQFERVAEVQSDKATVEISSRYEGMVKKLHYSVNEMAKVGEPLVDIETGEAGVVDEVKKSEVSNDQVFNGQVTIEQVSNEQVTIEQARISGDVRVMPSVRKVAKERGINLSQVTGSGKNGRILLEDLQDTCTSAKTTSNYSVITLNPVKKAMIKAMEASLSVPHFNYCDEYRFDSLLRARQQFIEGTGLKVSLLPFVLKGVSRALHEFPILNAHYFQERKELRAMHEHNIGIAVDTPQGLTVPVLKGIQSKNVSEIAKELQSLTQRARDNALKQEDFQDATISFSNIGSIGGTYASPLIVPPQVAIGALGRTRPQVTTSATPGQGFEVWQVASVSWAADHRVIDGATMARFSNRVKELLESPLRLILE